MKTTPPSKINNGSGKLYLLRQERVFAKKEWLTSWTEQQGAKEANLFFNSMLGVKLKPHWQCRLPHHAA